MDKLNIGPEPTDSDVLDILNDLDSIDPLTGKPIELDPDSMTAADFIRITTTKDYLTTSITILTPPSGITFTKDDIMAGLRAGNVTTGILDKTIDELVAVPIYDRPVIIAQGTAPVNGEGGHYEFLFQTKQDARPRILSDGSVDYSSYDNFYLVSEGDELVHYIPATRGTDGVGVDGRVLPAKKGADLPKLKGKSFHISNDGQIYYASIEGRPTYDENSLMLNVTNVLEIDSDVTHSTGNVVFSGDIHIRGSVYTGTIIQAKGCISVDGHVEGAHLIAGKDVTLKGGMQGTGKGVIESGGCVQGKFFEQVRITCKGDFTANSIMNCTIRCYGKINVNGRLGIIVGGQVFALHGIHATMIGNMAEVRTIVSVGMDDELMKEKLNCDKNYTIASIELEKINSGVAQLTELIARTDRADLKEKKMLLMRARISKGSQLQKLKCKKEEYDQLIEETSNSRIAVQKGIFPRVTVIVNRVPLNLTSQNYNVTYKLSEGEISTVPTG